MRRSRVLLAVLLLGVLAHSATVRAAGLSKIYEVWWTGPGSTAVPEAIDEGTKAVASPGLPWGITASAVPGGNRILLTRADGTLNIANSDGTGPLGAVGQQGSPYSPQLVPNMTLDGTGGRVAFLRAGELHAGPVAGGSDTDLHQAGTDAVISPDGRQVAFADSDGNLDLVGTDGTGFRRLVSASPYGPRHWHWLPDGRLLVMVASTGGACGQDVVTVEAATGAVKPLGVAVCDPSGASFNRVYVQDVAPSPDGTQLAVEGVQWTCSPAPGFMCSGGGETPPSGIFIQDEIGIVPAAGGPFGNVVRRLPGQCLGSGSCEDPNGGQVSSGPTTFIGGMLWWGGERLPVVLVTGLADSTPGLRPGGDCSTVGSMATLCGALQRNGFPVYVASSRSGPGAVIDNRQGFDANGRSLAAFVKDVVGTKAFFVGHSMGGIFSRVAISRYGAPAAGLFTIGSPHDGSWGADLAVGAALFPCPPLVPACAALHLAGEFAGTHFGGAALWDLTRFARTLDNASLKPPGVPTWTFGGTGCHPFGRSPGYLFPHDGIVGLSSAYGLGGANLGPTVRSSKDDYHEGQLRAALVGACGAGRLELDDLDANGVTDQVVAAALSLQNGTGAAGLARAAARSVPKAILYLQTGSYRAVRPGTRIPLGARASVLSKGRFTIRCDGRRIAALPAIGRRAFGFPAGALSCRHATLSGSRRVRLGIAGDADHVQATVARARSGFVITVSASRRIAKLVVTRRRKVLRLRAQRRGPRALRITVPAGSAGLTLTATVGGRRYTATISAFG